MVERPNHLTLRLSAGAAVNLRSGDLVSVQLLKHLGGGRWAVGIRGRVVTAVSELQLTAGQRLSARVGVEGGKTVLRLQQSRGAPLDALLRRLGLPVEPEVRQIVEGFLRSGLGVKPEQVGQARKLLEKSRLDPRRVARFAALAAEKGIDLQSPGLEDLLPILGYGEEREGRRRYRGRPMPEKEEDLQEDLAKDLRDAEGRSDGQALQLFNHLRGRGGTWVVIPFHYTYGSEGHLYGTVRLLYDEAAKTSRRLVLVVEGCGEEPGGPTAAPDGSGGQSAAPLRWSFTVDPDGESHRVRLFASRPASGPLLADAIRRLGLKLHNLGVEIDDTIRIDDGFDGFSPPEDAPAYRSIDVER